MTTTMPAMPATPRLRVELLDDADLEPEREEARPSRLARFALVFASLSPLGHDAAAREAQRVLRGGAR